MKKPNEPVLYVISRKRVYNLTRSPFGSITFIITAFRLYGRKYSMHTILYYDTLISKQYIKKDYNLKKRKEHRGVGQAVDKRTDTLCAE